MEYWNDGVVEWWDDVILEGWSDGIIDDGRIERWI